MMGGQYMLYMDRVNRSYEEQLRHSVPQMPTTGTTSSWDECLGDYGMRHVKNGEKFQILLSLATLINKRLELN